MRVRRHRDQGVRPPDRTPLVLPADFYDKWLNRHVIGDDELRAEALAVAEETVEQLVYAPA